MAKHDDWITVRQGANTLGIGIARMYQLIKDGKIPAKPLPYGARPALHVSKKACQDRKSSLHPPTEAQ